ncbi:MAG: hypothetical protein ABIY55_20435 [Kofleriaceae bacterium]
MIRTARAWPTALHARDRATGAPAPNTAGRAGAPDRDLTYRVANRLSTNVPPADVDGAWSGHHLAAQFRASGLNALFVACEAPGDATQPVAWTSLRELLELVLRATGALPDGRVVAIGHSGAHRTLVRWLDEPRLDTMALVEVKS